MTSSEHDDYWEALFEGELTPEISARVEAHRACCPQCDRLTTMLGLRTTGHHRTPTPSEEVRSTVHASSVPPQLLRRVLEEVHRRPMSAKRNTQSVTRAWEASFGRLGRWKRVSAGAVAVLVVVLLAPGRFVPSLGGSSAVAAVPFRAACDEESDRGVVVAGVWSGQEQKNFTQVLRRFAKRKGADVTFAYQPQGHDIADTLRARIAAGCAPDVALLPMPGFLAELAKDGRLQPLDGSVGPLANSSYTDQWRQLASVSGTLYGVPFKASNKSLFWYSEKAFGRANIEQAPTTWDELKRAATAIAASGPRPFSVPALDGWPGTDLFEAVYLATAGPEMYDKLARHEIPWTDPSVIHALATLAELYRDDWLAGGRMGAYYTDYASSVAQVFADPPQASMVFAGDFIANEMRGDTKAKSFRFPSIDPSISGPELPILAGADIAVLLKDGNPKQRGAAEDLIRFLATPAAAELWVKSGGFVSPNRNVSLDWYFDPDTRWSAQRLAREENFRFDLSDLQAPNFGSVPNQGMWKLLREFVLSPTNANGTAQQLEAARQSCRVC